MNTIGIRIIPQKLTEARLSRGYNISKLAECIGISRQAVSRYEKGEVNPSIEVLTKISQILKFPNSFFMQNRDDVLFNEGVVFYRSLKTSEENMRCMIKTRCSWTYRVYNYLNQYITMPKINLPNLDYLLNNDMTQDNIEKIANAIREYWNLGYGPISNLTLILEKNGFVISGAKVGATKTDACSEIIDGTPVIFYDKSLKSSCRIRFSIAHELAHIIMHGYITREDLKDKSVLDRIEREANIFASCFLLPKKSFMSDICSLSLQHFLILKEKWKVSLSAIIYRCKSLDLIDEDEHLILRKKISYKHWNKIEPLDNEIPIESPSLLIKAANFLFKNSNVTKTDLINYFSFNIDDLSDVFSCNTDFWIEDGLFPKFSIIT